jgi:hypothetical protein
MTMAVFDYHATLVGSNHSVSKQEAAAVAVQATPSLRLRCTLACMWLACPIWPNFLHFDLFGVFGTCHAQAIDD